MENLQDYMRSSRERDEEDKEFNNEFSQEHGWEDDEPAESAGLRKLFESELNGMYCIESTLTQSLPDLIKYASLPTLIDTLTDHLQITYKHVARLHEIHAILGKEHKDKECDTVKSILREANEVIQHTRKGMVRDAAIILAAKKIEHYEISIYDTLYSYAMILGERKVACMLNQSLEEEKKADLALTSVSASFIDPNTLSN